MSGIGLVLNLAKDAILTQQYAIDVISHNIANVSTEGYARQVPMLEAQNAAPYAGHLFGRGVKLSDIQSVTNAFIEKRLQSATSNLSMMSEKETYMNIMETIFTENSGNSISNQLSQFWNALNDLNNNPSGIPERNILTEYASLLAQSFQDTNSDLLNLSKEVNNSIEVSINSINEILDQIADINKQIQLVRITGNPNDLINKRDLLVKDLSTYLDINTYEYEDGTISVSSNKGFMLVNKQASYHLDFNGVDITWSTNSTPITDNINGGKLGGWLDIRDEIIPKFKSDLDELAKAIIWEVNKIHSQGVGLNGFTSVTGTYKVTDSSEAIGSIDSGLDYYDRIKDGSFKIWLYNADGDVELEATIPVDTGTSLDVLRSVIDGYTGLNASITNGSLNIQADAGYTFAFSDDNSNILAALGINTFFKASNARDMGLNDMIIADKNYIAAGIISNGEIYPGDNTNSLNLANLQYQNVSVKKWIYSRGESPTSLDVTNITMDNYYHQMVGSIGIESQSVQREKAYTLAIQQEMQATRDNISAVSLDEEMTNLIKYQHAYMAAAKLITTAQQMLDEILKTV
ncbi:MAG: flagellar hook-associated protein FlgK [Desulfatiglans sp.]|jgi:flagellar hook-associated protein 1 FlgK|nr:flagellar hook-associated protein FlgK [Desulfatiglans sp.]